MGRHKKIKSVKEMEELWEKYKEECDHRMVLTHSFSSKEAIFVSKELERSVPYTIKGFCLFAHIARSKFYENYADDDKFRDTVSRMREECEVDLLEKLELGMVPTQLAGLLLSEYGYTTKSELAAHVKTSEKLSDVFNQLGGEGLEE